MRRSTTSAALSAALIAGLIGTASPATASSGTTSLVVEDTIVRESTIPSTELIAQAEREGTPYSAKEVRALKKSSCRKKEYKRGLRARKKGRWLIWVKLRLDWCYDGYQVTSARYRAQSYSYDRYTWRWRGWGKKRFEFTEDGGSVIAEVKAKFYYTGNRKVYKPHIGIWGAFDGSSDWWGWRS
ncbi:hypothetical protein ABGB12_26560 [Actinocorallia sp. B10E7]|uniref:hypothetical protein n=1 Tax=Actinocorallia sp. B10E7 TaxID=3153558 RepID=UPI00325CC989